MTRRSGGRCGSSAPGLYLDRYWRDECQVAADLRALTGASAVDEAVLTDGLGRLWGIEERDLGQRRAAEVAVRRRLAVVAGGPGTGKTTTVARIVALLAEQAGEMPLVALAAPTGKAATRLRQAVHDEAERARRRPVGARGPAGTARVDAAPAARLAARLAQPLQARPRQPAPARRGDRRRDLDGLPDADGAAGRGGAADGAAGAGRRSRAADLDRGGCGAGGHRGRGRRRASRCSSRCTAGRRGSRSSGRRSGATTPDAAIATLRAGHADITWIPVDAGDPEALDALGLVRERAVAWASAVIDFARGGR